jgi:hypothetical protein
MEDQTAVAIRNDLVAVSARGADTVHRVKKQYIQGLLSYFHLVRASLVG